MRISSSAWRGKPQILLESSVCGRRTCLFMSRRCASKTHRNTLKRKELRVCKTLDPCAFGSSPGGVLGKFYGQATKGVRWMPWRQQAMKDAVSCEKLRGAANRP